MAKVEVELPDRIVNEMEQMVAQGEFVNEDEAVEKLLQQGVAAYGPIEEEEEAPGQDLFTQSTAEQQDPAAMDDPQEDDYGF
jgi:Arc/MetJ-type ribon-helix-helix transcriptional regulator